MTVAASAREPLISLRAVTKTFGSGATAFQALRGVDLEIGAGDRSAWKGNATASQLIFINAPELFGGTAREGGIQGYLALMFGEDTQPPNPYLVAQLGPRQPAYRGVFSAVFQKGMVAAMNPYLKPWAYRIRRTTAGWEGGTAWYPAKAEVDVGGMSGLGLRGQLVARRVGEDDDLHRVLARLLNFLRDQPRALVERDEADALAGEQRPKCGRHHAAVPRPPVERHDPALGEPAGLHLGPLVENLVGRGIGDLPRPAEPRRGRGKQGQDAERRRVERLEDGVEAVDLRAVDPVELLVGLVVDPTVTMQGF